jgi:hypothetical protein
MAAVSWTRANDAVASPSISTMNRFFRWGPGDPASASTSDCGSTAARVASPRSAPAVAEPPSAAPSPTERGAEPDRAERLQYRSSIRAEPAASVVI